MEIHHRIQTQIFIDRALFEFHRISLNRLRHGSVAAKFDEDFVPILPVPDLTEYLPLFEHPIKSDKDKFLQAMDKVLSDMLDDKKLRLRLAGAASYFTEQPRFNFPEFKDDLKIDWNIKDYEYLRDRYLTYSIAYSFPAWDVDIWFTNKDELTLANPIEEKYLNEGNYLYVMLLREFNMGISLFINNPLNKGMFTEEEEICRQFVKLVMDKHYIPIIMKFDAELRSFIASVDAIIDEKLSLLLSKREVCIPMNGESLTLISGIVI